MAEGKGIVEFFLDPFSYDFFPRALIAASLVMGLGALAGVSVKAQGQIYLGQGMSQSLLAGVAAASLAGVSGFFAGFLAAVLAAVLVGFVARFAKTGFDVAIAVVSSSLMSIGIVFLTLNRDKAVNVTNLLFGNVLGVSNFSVVLIAVITVVTGGFFVMFSRKLALAALDPSVALGLKLNVKVLNLVQIIVVSLAIASFVQVAGTLLSIVALVIPTAAAQFLAKSLSSQHLLGVVLGVFSAVVGLFLSFYTDLPSGPSIALVAGLMFSACFIISTFRHPAFGKVS